MNSVEVFKAVFGGHVFHLDSNGQTKTRNAWEAFTECRDFTFPKVQDASFKPLLEPGLIFNHHGRTKVNTYKPQEVKKMKGDASPFLKHLEKMIPIKHDREILLAYMAAIVQYKGTKFRWTPLIQGAEGNGKSFLMKCVAYAVGENHVHYLNSDDIGNGGNATKFNAWLPNKIFVAIEEVYSQENRNIAESLKKVLTDERLEIQGKGGDQFTGDNCANFMCTSNFQDAIRKTLDNRRWAVFFTDQQSYKDILAAGMGGDYFPKLFKWLNGDGYAIMADFLTEYDIPDELNPATFCHRAPDTSSTSAVINRSLGGAEQDIIEAIEQEMIGFKGGWVSSMALDKMFKDNKRLTRHKRKEIIESLGYILHPSLTNGRVNRRIELDGGKPSLYIRHDHLHINLKTPVGVADQYVKDQGLLTSPSTMTKVR